MPIPETAAVLLQNIERRLKAVDARLLAPGPAGLEAACIELRDATVAFAKMLETTGTNGTRRAALDARIATIAQRLHDQRTCVARRGVVVERALDSILRRPQAPTYRINGERMKFDAAAAVSAR